MGDGRIDGRAVRGAPRQDAPVGDPAVRRRARAPERRAGQTVDEGPCRRPGLGFVPRASVVPHYDAWPEPLTALIALQSPRDSVVLGIDEDTGIVGTDGAWQVRGRSRVTVWRGRHRERYRAGDTFRL